MQTSPSGPRRRSGAGKVRDGRVRRRRRLDRAYRILSGLFFLSLMTGVVAVMAFLVRMVLPVL